uniref:NADH dehydrogenase subunit 4L n=1 Tax=Sorineuchora formosana TaxID=3037028 RepID=UPI0027A04C69|nr:NADH dehydrogenase subunit 4L [Sorineuchora formosana]WGO57648.1 NADH dehydrogenase subunit 4L [Sorineuchora formosana]
MMELIFFVFFCGSWVYCSSCKHLLVTLLSLEFIVLSLYLLMYFFFYMFNYELYFLIVFLTFSVCEGSLGLSVMISMVRSCGNDYMNSYSMLQC